MLCIFIFILQNAGLICKCATSFKRNASHAAFDLPQYRLGNIRRCRAKVRDCRRRVKIHHRGKVLFLKVFPWRKPKPFHNHIGCAFLQHFLKPCGCVELAVFLQIAAGKGLQKRAPVICAVILHGIVNDPIQLIGKGKPIIFVDFAESVYEFFQDSFFLFFLKLPECKRNIAPRVGV